MSLYKYISCLLLTVITACSNEDFGFCPGLDVDRAGQITCNTESRDTSLSRTYFEHGLTVYWSKWNKEDQIAMCFDGADTAARFNLLTGENSASAVFYGPVPDNYNMITAVYPFDIFRERTSTSIKVCLPSTISYNAQQILCGAMPMFAQGSDGSLNFYNLMSVIKISVQGNGLLRGISISSPDGLGMSGNGRIITDKNNIPSLLIEDAETTLTINTGAIFLSDNPQDIYLPIPAATYENGLKLEFQFEGRTETRVLGALSFERAVMRAVKPYEISVPFDFNSYETKENEIWYKSDGQQDISDKADLDTPIISHSFSKSNRLGVITTQSPIVKIGGPLFKSPEYVTFVKLPDSVQEIAMSSFENAAIETFDAPNGLRIIGTDAFFKCNRLRKVVLNDGLESLGLQVFGECPNLESVYIPGTVTIIGAYIFRESTSKLDHWDGDCPHIDKDRHALYSTSAYGVVTEKSDMIDIIAGCNLTEYRIPDQALFTQNYAFSGLGKLKRLIIHENFIGFGLYVFSSLTKLETIISYAATPPHFNPDEDFSSASLKEIRVPKSCVDKYKEADGWKAFSDKIIALP